MENNFPGIPYIDENPYVPIPIWGSETTFGDGWYHLDRVTMETMGLGNIQGEYIVNYTNDYVISISPFSYQGGVLYTTDKVSIKQVAPSYVHCLVLRSDGTLWSTGQNAYGQLGLGDMVPRKAFEKVAIEEVKAFSTKYVYKVALKQHNTLFGWGNNNGIFMDSSAENKVSPTQIPITNIKEIYAGGHSLYFLKQDGSFWGYGRNLEGQVGNGANEEILYEPIKINFIQVGRNK